MKSEGKVYGYSGWVWMKWEGKLSGCCWGSVWVKCVGE